jgi:NAD(P)-dependent dehydrogenase (short-subunit alcohol dehydrogenase family)
MDLGLKGKVAVVTGGSSGIGLAVARGFAAEGAQVAICGRNEKRLSEAADGIRADFGTRVVSIGCDVTSPEEIGRFAARIDEQFGGADILINNAGAGSEETIMEAPDERWQQFWELLVMSVVRTSRAIVPSMRKRGGGVIVNNASICAVQPLYHEPIYDVMKAAVVMFSKCLANELIRDNIRVNCINPGLIHTPAWEAGAESLGQREGVGGKEYMERIADRYTPIGRFGTAEELADFFLFLCSERASYCVGSTYYVDGGWLRVTT